MIKDPNTDWVNINISENLEKSLKNTELLFEIKARQMNQQLQSSLTVKDIKSNKIKV